MPTVNHGPKLKWGIPEINRKFQIACSSEEHDEISWHPAAFSWKAIVPLSGMSTLYVVPTRCYSLRSLLGYQSDCGDFLVPVFTSPFFCLIMAPKLKSSDAGNLDVPERS